jgi:beta-galactosidase
MPRAAVRKTLSLVVACLVVAIALPLPCPAQSDMPLPRGVKAVWTPDKAYRETTPTRERICINGLWRWQPARSATDKVPTDRWGYFKVPGCWPGITSYNQKDCQTVYRHPSWKRERLANITMAWYQREVTIPRSWAGRRITLYAEYLNSYAAVTVDGKKAGEMRFPCGELDLTPLCRPGSKHVLSLLTIAMPLKGVMLSYNDTTSATRVKGSVARRGLCGDVFLVSTPSAARIGDVKIDTSVRQWQITLTTAVADTLPGRDYRLRARVTDHGRTVKEFVGNPFKAADLKDGRFRFTRPWKPAKLWDVHTPGNMYELHLSLLDADGKVLDTYEGVRFGFREFWIDGRDFRLNGTRFFCSAVPLDNAHVGAALASYEGARESMLRLRSFGINTVYTHNYGCQPGSHLGFEEILRAADDVGLLVAFSQPHFGHYDWTAPDADQTNGYARHAAFYVRVAQNHPSVVMYAMSHNATGYSEDMNPDMIDGIHDARSPWAAKNVKRALRAEAIVKRLDPNRIVYHHSSGNLGSMHTSNFYLNFVPIQERSDWFEHWATQGVKPLFLCEYGVPLSWNWTMYRGWYKGKRTFGSAKVPWEFCLAEWNAQFMGDRAYRISEMEKVNLRWEAKQFRAGRLWHRWDYPYRVGSNPRRFDSRHAVWTMYITDNWPAFRTWEVSASSPWNFGVFWKLRDGVDEGRRELQVDWDRLQRPGFSADYIEKRYERMDLAFERSDWIPTSAGKTLVRNNQPLLAYLGGKPSRFTSKDHNYFPGDTVEKQLIIINNSRETVACDCTWSFGFPRPSGGSQKVSVETGQQQRIRLRCDLPASLRPGTYPLTMKVRFGNGQTQKDSFALHVLPKTPSPGSAAKIALFDPRRETGNMLSGMGIRYESVDASADLAGYDMLIVGKGALTPDRPAPDIQRVRDGLKVLMFEQTADVLEKRFGFRVQEYGLRRVFRRVPDHPILAGLESDHLRDWRGEATIAAPRLRYKLRPGHGPTITRCGIQVTRPWRCGCRGNVASVLIEKPARGDFLPIVDGGFSLQYSPLLEYHEGRGMMLLCQMDVTGRTEPEPAAARLVSNLLAYITTWRPSPRRKAVYAGNPAGKAHLEKVGMTLGRYDAGRLAPEHVLIVGPGGDAEVAPHKRDIAAWLKRGGHILAIGLTERQARAVLPIDVRMTDLEHIAAFFEPPGAKSLLAGIGPADVHSRDPRRLPLVTGGAVPVGNGVLAVARDANVVLCQLVPWQFDPARTQNLRRTFRRTSRLLTRLLGNMGSSGATPLLARFANPVQGNSKQAGRWLQGFYLEKPEEWDDPYRFFRW